MKIETSSPLKVLKMRTATIKEGEGMPQRSPRKISSPDKRFPVKVSLSIEPKKVQEAPQSNKLEEHMVDLRSRLRDNEGLTKAIQIMEDEDDALDFDDHAADIDEITATLNGETESYAFADETAFSTFSAVPDMTMFAKIGHSPSKSLQMGQTSSHKLLATPGGRRDLLGESSPMPRRHQDTSSHADKGDTTNLILDFTEQFNSLSNYGDVVSTRRGLNSPSKRNTVPDLFSYTQNARTPSPAKHRDFPASPSSRMSNLLDFDIPPAPTPRSLPSITPRELESLKSGFLSEISSLKASLSGKEAEILSLKSAVRDAEKRVGESMEEVREQRNMKEQLAFEKEEWEKRCREMEQVLRNVKEEIVHGERERDDLEGRLDESEKRREAAEMMAQEAESKMASMRAVQSSGAETDGEGKKVQPSGSSREVEFAVEKVARELHTLYKSKHETKVAALKKSYEGRWDKKVRELEAKLEELSRENEELRIGRDATMSGVVPRIPNYDMTQELKAQAAEDAQHAKELEARLEGLLEEVRSIKGDNAELRQELEQERVEKGELVAACDELLALQESAPPSHPAISSGVEHLRGSISRASGLRAPNFASSTGPAQHAGESRIGRSKGSGVPTPRPGSGLGLRSGIMSSIEKMGSYKGRPE
jgi:hypothetical protein